MTIPAKEESVVVVREVETLMEGFTAWRNKENGFRVLDIAYFVDPHKRTPEWLAQAKAGMPSAEWEREYGKKWIVYDGRPVYADFNANAHVVQGSLIAPKRSRLISGWDGGPNDVHLAWVLGLVNMTAQSVVWIDEYYVDDGDIHSFVQLVGQRLNLEWFRLGGFSLHIADQSVFTQSGVAGDSRLSGRAMADVMRLHRMSPIPGEISLALRRNVVEKMLMEGFTASNEGHLVPKWRVHERCPVLIEAMQGGYAYPKVNMGIGGEYKPFPMKNKYSHIANAMEYACSRLEVAAESIPYEGKKLPRRTLI